MRKESDPSEALQDSATPDAKQRMEITMATLNADLAQKVLQVGASPASFQPRKALMVNILTVAPVGAYAEAWHGAAASAQF